MEQLILSASAVVFATLIAVLMFDLLERGWHDDDNDHTTK